MSARELLLMLSTMAQGFASLGGRAVSMHASLSTLQELAAESGKKLRDLGSISSSPTPGKGPWDRLWELLLVYQGVEFIFLAREPGAGAAPAANADAEVAS